MNPKLSVVVPILNYDSIGFFMQTLQVAWNESIEIIILDSSKFGERQDSVNYDESGKSTIIRAIIDPPFNFHGIWNLGLRMARGEYIALVNDDLLFGYKSLRHCVDAIDKFELPVVYPMHTSGPADINSFEAEGRKAAQRPLEFVGPPEYRGFCWVFAADIFDHVGYFDEQFELYYGDNDMWYRLIQAGWPPRCVHNALIHHFESRTTNIVQSKTGKDFKAISEADRKLFKAKWGKTNAKQLLRELRFKKSHEARHEAARRVARGD
jgi:glycosyltransferase involved in cell wall biosynthesis